MVSPGYTSITIDARNAVRLLTGMQGGILDESEMQVQGETPSISFCFSNAMGSAVREIEDSWVTVTLLSRMICGFNIIFLTTDGQGSCGSSVDKEFSYIFKLN